MVPIRNLNLRRVVVQLLRAGPLLLNGRQYGPPMHARMDVRHGLRRPGLGVEDAWVGEVVVHLIEGGLLAGVPGADLVAGLLGDEVVYVGAGVPAS